MTVNLQSITIPASTPNPKGLIVALHGWGANAEDLTGLTPYLNLPEYTYIFPDAPFPYPYSPNGRAWYDLRVENMYAGLTQTRETLLSWLTNLERETGIPLSRTILSGFSQGGAMTLDIGLRLDLAGLVCMSGYLHPELEKQPKPDFTSFPSVLMMHGQQDTVVPLGAAHKAKSLLESWGVNVEYHEFSASHEINLQMLEKLRNFIQRQLP